MTKKTLLAYIVLIGCVILLSGSYLQWKDKLSFFYGEVATSEPQAKNNTKNSKSMSEVVEENRQEDEEEQFLELIKNQDESVQDLFLDRKDNDEELQLLIVGSTVMEDGNPGYAERLDNALKKAYGDFLQTTTVSYDGTSDQFMNDGIEEIDFDTGYDVILFEPFTLKNNGIVSIEDEHVYIQRFQDKLVSSVKDAVIILHPAQPIHHATNYPARVSTLESFAKEHDLPYIDHWADWPDSDSDEILEYLTVDGAPNNDGADIWANALIHYFISDTKTEED